MFSKLRSRAPKFEAFIQSRPILFFVSLFDWPRRKVKSLYAWMVGWAETKNAARALAAFAFIESSFFPIPPDPLLITMTTVKPEKYLRFATICTLGSVVGGAFGYLIGVGLFETLGQWVINTYNLHQEFTAIGVSYEKNAFLTVFTAAFTPIPYKLITIAAGVFKVNFAIFMIASVIGRGARFFLVATLMHHFGKRYKDQIEKYIDLLSLLFMALVILGLVAVKYLF